jgi:hypothetical protein
MGMVTAPTKPAVAGPAAVVIDRERHCPFLLRVFCNVGSHNKCVRIDENCWCCGLSRSRTGGWVSA